MLVQWILFFGLALVAVGSAVGMLLSKNAIYAALNLVINFVTVAAFYLMLNAPFISMTQVTVYAGAIMVLFLFVIMLLGAEHLGGSDTMPWQKYFSLGLGVLLIAEIAYLLAARSGGWMQGAEAGADFGSPTSIGLALFNTYLLPFEVISLLLLAAMVGAIVLARRNRPASRPDGGEHATN